MATLTTEAVKFEAQGVETLGQAYEKMQAESLKLKVQNSQLSQQMKDGSFLKQATDLQKAAQATAKLREEQRKLWDAGKKQLLDQQKQQQRIAGFVRRNALEQRYGLTFGTLAFKAQGFGGGALGLAQKYGGRASEFAREAGGGALGMAGAAGATLGYGSLVNRGFSGTAAAARLDTEFEMLSRKIASDLLPALNWFTRRIRDINNARGRIQSGKGGLLDYPVGYAPEIGALASTGLLAKWGASKMGFGGAAASSASLWSSAAGNAAGGAAGGWAARSGGFLKRFGGPLALGYLAYETQDTLRNYNPYENKGDLSTQKKANEEYLRKNDTRTWAQRNFPNLSYMVGLSGGGPPGEVAAAKMEKNPDWLPPGMQFVQGMGKKSNVTDIYEELQQELPKRNIPEDGGEKSGSVTGEAIAGIFQLLQRLEAKLSH